METNRRPRAVAILAVVAGVVSGLWSALATLMVVTFARITYYLPPPSGATEATEHHDWSLPTLQLLSLSVVGMVFAVVACVVGVRGLVRRLVVRSWVLLLPGAALVLATLAMLLARSVTHGTY